MNRKEKKLNQSPGGVVYLVVSSTPATVELWVVRSNPARVYVGWSLFKKTKINKEIEFTKNSFLTCTNYEIGR
jgi:hypothetical protein